MKKLILLFFIPSLLFGQTIGVDSVRTTQTPNQGRNVWNTDIYLLRDSTLTAMGWRDNGTLIRTRTTSDSVFIGDTFQRIGLFSVGGTSHFSSPMTLGLGSTTAGSIAFFNSLNDNTITLTPNSQSGSRTLKLPTLTSATDTLLTNRLMPGVLTRGATSGQFPAADGAGSYTWTSLNNVTVNVAQNFVPYFPTANSVMNAAFYWEPTNKTIGVGIATGLDVEEVFHGRHETGNTIITLDAFSSSGFPQLKGTRAEGTSSAPTAITSGSNLITLSGYGYDGASYALNARLNLAATQDFTTTHHGTAIDIRLTPTDSSTIQDAYTIYSNKILIEGTTSNNFEGLITWPDWTRDDTLKVPDATGAIVLSTLANNAPDTANAIWLTSNTIQFEGATANSAELTLTVADPASDKTVTFSDATGTVMLSTFATNAPEVANSVWGVSAGLRFEGATADGNEVTIAPTDPTGTDVFTLPDTSGTAMVSLLSGNAPEHANGVWGVTNGLRFEGATANNFEGTISPADITSDRTWTMPDQDGTVFLSTLATNAPNAAGSVWAEQDSLTFEGLTADNFETRISTSDPLADMTWYLPRSTVLSNVGGFLMSALNADSIGAANTVFGESNNLVFEGATANTSELRLTVADPAQDDIVTFADTTGTVLLSTLSTNAPEKANSIWGESNRFVFEGATANSFEMRLLTADPAQDDSVTFPDTSGTAVLSTLSTNAPEKANSVWGESNNWVFEGATNNSAELRLTVADPAQDDIVTFADTTGTVVLSTLSTNAPEKANSVWGESNNWVFEGATNNAFEMRLTVADPAQDDITTFADTTGTVFLSTLSTNAPEKANSVWGVSNGLSFEGATNNAFESTIKPTDPTHDDTLYVPDTTGTAVVSTSGKAFITSVKMTADTTFTGGSSATNTDISALEFAVVSGHYYNIHFDLTYQTAATTTGIEIGATTPTFTRYTAGITYIGVGTAAQISGGMLAASGDTMASPSVVAINTDYTCLVDINILPSADGIVKLRCSSEVASSNMILRQGSNGILREIP